MSEDYTKVIEDYLKIKPQGKAVYFVDDKCFEVDYNFNPPRVTEIDVPEIEEQEEEEC